MTNQHILHELSSREPVFHHPDKFGKTEADIRAQVDENFWEVGASGNVYTKEDVIKILLDRYNDPDYEDIWETKNFQLMEIAPNNYLLTYVLIQNKTRITRRTTLWRFTDMGWKIVYHQGTVVGGLRTNAIKLRLKNMFFLVFEVFYGFVWRGHARG